MQSEGKTVGEVCQALEISEQTFHRWRNQYGGMKAEDGRHLKLLPVIDEYTREALSLEVGRCFTSADVIEVLTYLFEVRGAPQFIRSDNGPEFISHAIRHWLQESGVQTLFIEPGSPRENAYVESFNSRLRDELLDRELFTSLDEARVVLEDHRLDYNHRRPHSSLGYMTPAEYAARLREDNSAPAQGACAPSPSRVQLVPTLIGAGT
jgi:putative transposase